MKGLNWKTIFAGVIIDLVVTLAVSFVIGIVAGMMLMSRGVPNQQLERQVMTWLPSVVASLVLGSGATTLGGFVAAGASSSRQGALKNALAMGTIMLVMTVLSQMVVKENVPLWYNIVAYAPIIPAALFGGHLRSRRISKERARDPFQPPIPQP